jgi:hypothetical protein
MTWKIQPTSGGYWLFCVGKGDAWWHVYRDQWFAVFPTLDAVFAKIKERT